jgi:hypothetical protein
MSGRKVCDFINYFAPFPAYTYKFAPKATTPFKPQKELLSVAFLV